MISSGDRDRGLEFEKVKNLTNIIKGYIKIRILSSVERIKRDRS